ncbi:hypothetical protein O181_066313 [Austropuccinia psidii MF-1]|uniref:Integrase catalytic domain-containing protein n=1 Tax=Austropuccinia psidii MF-1 TaxID=1389203 RepID=A0A9Q3I3H8_9BASI|nr:hypothetical protein [Austropuccinia psidii MF-1]
MMIQIQEPRYPWQIVHIDWVTALPPGGDRHFNAWLVSVERYSKTPMLLPYHKDERAMDTAIMRWNRVIIHTGLLQNIKSDRDPKFSQHYGKIYIDFLEQNCHSPLLITIRMMV